MLTLILAALGISGAGTGTLILSPALRHWIAVKLGISPPTLNAIIAPVTKMLAQLDTHAVNAKAASAYHAKLSEAHADEAAYAASYSANLKAQQPQKAG